MKRKQETATEQRRLLRSESILDCRTDCVFCGKTTEPKQFNDKRQVRYVRTLEIKSTIKDICAQRNNS